MSIRLGDDAPNFKANTTIGEIDFHEYLGDSWGVLFSHPADFTPVCTTELGRTALLKSEFDTRNVKVLAVSVDAIDNHFSWVKDINETQHCSVDFPIIADEKREWRN
jgi:alkyl hydroperoxide reductase subunit AhpC